MIFIDSLCLITLSVNEDVIADADKYSIFKAVDPNSPSVFAPGQPQQQSKSLICMYGTFLFGD
jgi:hypothetical protein